MFKKFIMLDGERVTLIHNMPFDPVNGLGKTEDELKQVGVLLDEIPEPDPPIGKISIPYYTPEKGFYYVYEDAPSPNVTMEEVNALNAKIDYIAMMTEVL